MSYGWLKQEPGLPPHINGVAFDPAMTTRREEFTLVHRLSQSVMPGRCLDAGSGITPHQHVMPLILANDGWRTVATDINPISLDMPAHPLVERRVMDMTDMSELPDAHFDLVVSVSVLEHLADEDRVSFAAEAARLCKPGGLLCVTADEYDGLPDLFRENFNIGGELDVAGNQLSPRVYCVIGRRV
jgi:2-polyprenyl-3-methyl-5-hydroxy-6-metoxy-1,4-benzoquinol methylase